MELDFSEVGFVHVELDISSRWTNVCDSLKHSMTKLHIFCDVKSI